MRGGATKRNSKTAKYHMCKVNHKQLYYYQAYLMVKFHIQTPFSINLKNMYDHKHITAPSQHGNLGGRRKT